MKTRLLTLLGSLALASLLAPNMALASTSSNPVRDYNVTLTPVTGDRFPLGADLQLRIGADNVVSGYYHTQDDPTPRPVTGGRDGDKLWFDVGTGGGLHVEAHFAGRKIVGTAFDSRHREFDFSAARD